VRRKDQPGKPKVLASEAAERIGVIIEAAERAAAAVIDDSEAQARQYLSEAQAEADQVVAERLSSIAALTDSLVVEAEEIKSRSERLLVSLEEAKAQLGVNGKGSPVQAVEQSQSDGAAAGAGSRGSHLIAVTPVEEPWVEETPTDKEQPSIELGTPAGARLLATQMAVSGNSREEIAARLRNGFEIQDPDAILDAILGPEG
jgi:vacuolar-type H+-ATPase subunit H